MIKLSVRRCIHHQHWSRDHIVVFPRCATCFCILLYVLSVPCRTGPVPPSAVRSLRGHRRSITPSSLSIDSVCSALIIAFDLRLIIHVTSRHIALPLPPPSSPSRSHQLLTSYTASRFPADYHPPCVPVETLMPAECRHLSLSTTD